MNVNRDAVRGFFDSLAGSWDADRAEEPEKIRAILRRAGIGPGVEVLAPDSLRARLAALAGEIAERYSHPDTPCQG